MNANIIFRAMNNFRVGAFAGLVSTKVSEIHFDFYIIIIINFLAVLNFAHVETRGRANGPLGCVRTWTA